MTDYNAQFSPEEAANLSTLFDVGAILGGVAVGLISDFLHARAIICSFTFLIACPMMYIYSVYGHRSLTQNILLLVTTGALVNGPYAVIGTAVAADLGTHSSLQGKTKAFAMVSAIIDGTASVGAAFGPFLTGVLSQSGWQNVFFMLIGANLMAGMLLIRLVLKDVKMLFDRFKLCWHPDSA